ncbi:MAG: hypothetical protein ACK4N5_20215, partial [Myxococcales bacterium]
DAALAARVASIQSLAQPNELERSARELASAAAAPLPTERPLSAEQQAEMLFERGDYTGALATWERVLKARPDNQLARERLEEIRALLALRPQNAPEPALPADRNGMLEALLVRIASRRKA